MERYTTAVYTLFDKVKVTAQVVEVWQGHHQTFQITARQQYHDSTEREIVLVGTADQLKDVLAEMMLALVEAKEDSDDEQEIMSPAKAAAL